MFEIVNKDLHYVNEWFIANTLNARKTKYLFFHKQSARNSILLRLTPITFNSIKIKCEFFIKLLRVIIDENVIYKKHIDLAENNISRLCKAFEMVHQLIQNYLKLHCL